VITLIKLINTPLVDAGTVASSRKRLCVGPVSVRPSACLVDQ